MHSAYSRNVFINCPFDEAYMPIFHSIIFTVFDCGYLARCALEIPDSSEIRIEKIAKVITECKYGIHDISLTTLDRDTNLPRFNMPLELGMFMGAKRFGDSAQKKKICLILDKSPYRYQSFISDIAGQDIQAHKNDDAEVIRIVRNWLRSTSGSVSIPDGKEILRRYRQFKLELPNLCKKVKLTIDEMIFNDYAAIVYEWLSNNP